MPTYHRNSRRSRILLLPRATKKSTPSIRRRRTRDGKNSSSTAVICFIKFIRFTAVSSSNSNCFQWPSMSEIAQATCRRNLKDRHVVFSAYLPMEWVICSPDEYYSFRMTQFIQSECRLPRNQWIYNIIQNNVQDAGERVFIDTPAWCLCLDKHRCPCRHTANAFSSTPLPGACVSTSTGALSTYCERASFARPSQRGDDLFLFVSPQRRGRALPRRFQEHGTQDHPRPREGTRAYARTGPRTLRCVAARTRPRRLSTLLPLPTERVPTPPTRQTQELLSPERSHAATPDCRPKPPEDRKLLSERVDTDKIL